MIELLSHSILAPIVIKCSISASKQPKVLTSDLDDIPPSIVEKMYVCCKELEKLEFRMVGFFCTPDLMVNIKGTFALLQNLRNKTRAMVAAVMLTKNNSLTTFYIEFSTEFADGTGICTNNTAQLNTSIEIPGEKVYQFPMLKDAHLLYRAHDYLKSMHFGASEIVLNGIGEEREYLETDFAGYYAKRAELGYYYLSRDGTKYRLTWKGAFLMTWALIWPISTIRKILRHNKAKRTLKEMRIVLPIG